MNSRTVRITFHAFWHAGSGRGGGADLDATCLRSRGGLPYFPGRALKGLLREGAEVARLSPEIVTRLFGSDLPSRAAADHERVERALVEGRFRSTAGALRVGSARLGLPSEQDACERWGEENPLACAVFFDRLASTAIDEDGVALNKSLRTIEVALPLALHASVAGPADALDALGRVFPVVRAAGAHRARGLGRCTLEFAP